MKKSFTNKETAKKLASYSALAGAFVLIYTDAQGQIVYTDVNPDETIGIGDAYDLDMNNDDDVDFTIIISSLTIPSLFYTVAYGSVYYDGVFNLLKIYPTSGNAVNAYTVTGSAGTFAYPYALNNGEDIGPAANFKDNSTQYLGAYLSILGYPGPGDVYPFTAFGSWPEKSSKFLGVRFNDGGNDFYGWVRLSVSDIEITIEDYAYLGTPDGSIDAGQMPTAIEEHLSDNQISAYSFGNTVNIVVKDLQTSGAMVNIYNLSGQKVFHNALDLNGMQITMNTVASGNYTIEIITEENAGISKQVYIQN